MSVSLDEVRRVAAEADCLYTRDEVEAALDRMAAALTARLSEADPLILCVMLGGLLPTAKVVERLRFPFQYDYLHASRYRGEIHGGNLLWVAHPSIPLHNRTVVIVDDILDEGFTLRAIMNYCREDGAREVLSAVLVTKAHQRRAPDIRADFCGLEVPDRYVFGYGMDYKGYLRNAPGIFALKEGQ